MHQALVQSIALMYKSIASFQNILKLKSYSMQSIAYLKQSIAQGLQRSVFQFWTCEIDCMLSAIDCKLQNLKNMIVASHHFIMPLHSSFILLHNEKVASQNGKVASLHMDGSHGYIYFWILKFKNKRQYNTRQDKIIFQDLSIYF